ncbi:MAG: hypothetical protein HYV26_12710 [Candidatus Hydrogenedentes bacterium]|nr:hypothetical protein [Candidatus Hydrogenedentota bacterium]
MVVVTAGAALEGAVTRQAVLDYVAEGGALLFLGGGAPVEAVAGPAPAADTWAALLSWLAPLDVQIRMDKPVQGTFEAPGDEVLTRHWHTFRLAAGPGIEAPAASVLVPAGEPTMGAFVVREYGYGRVALLSADSPLGDTAFAADLFEWLARANRDRHDMDGDLLPDGLEDKDNNGNLDAGETSFLNPDTDGDGIPDGLEDRNRSGGTDDSETDPRNVDSDSDGLFDGADPLPLPPLDAPRLLAAVPAVAPAEGNQAVLILGRNLTPQSRFWFGERPAAWARLFNSGHAEAWLPDAGTNEGGPVTLRVVTADGQEALLPGGFTYRARTKVVLKLISSARTEAEIGRGSLTVMLAPAAREDAPPRLSRLLLLLRSSVGAALVWEKSEATARLAEAGGTIQVRPSEAGSILMEAHPGRAGGIPYGSVFRVSWRVNWAALTEALVTVEAPIALVFTAHEGTLAVEKELLVLTPAGAAPPAPQRQVE